MTCSWLLQGSVLYREALAETKVAGFQGALQAKQEAAKKAAEVAGQELLAEEEQQQARAAAKKAKKQRQKAKKAQPVTSVTQAVGSLDLEAEKAVDSSEQPSPSAANAPATSALLTDANMLQLFRCPITKVVCVLVICQPVLICSLSYYVAIWQTKCCCAVSQQTQALLCCLIMWQCLSIVSKQ